MLLLETKHSWVWICKERAAESSWNKTITVQTLGAHIYALEIKVDKVRQWRDTIEYSTLLGGPL